MKATVHVVPEKRPSAALKTLARKLAAAKKSQPSSLPSRARIRAAARKLAAQKGKNAHLWKIVKTPDRKGQPLSVYSSKQAAIDGARKIARNVIVHGGSGQILQKSDAESDRLSETRLREAIRKLIAKR